jgi:hypothetical protein
MGMIFLAVVTIGASIAMLLPPGFRAIWVVMVVYLFGGDETNKRFTYPFNFLL